MTLDTTYEAFRAAAEPGHLVPVAREISADTLTPVAAYAALARPPFGFLLESLVGGERWARYTYLGTEPREVWRYQGGNVERWTPATGWQAAGATADPLAHVGAMLRHVRAVAAPGLPRFVGGAVGFFAYDVVRSLERLPAGPPDDLTLPDAVFVVADRLVIMDNVHAKAVGIANVAAPDTTDEASLREAFDGAQQRITELVDRLDRPPRLHPLSLHATDPVAISSPYARDAFERDVLVIQEHIRAGDAFQVVLSRRQDARFTGRPFDVYRALRMLNPAPYLYYLDLDGLQLAGSSPEVLVRVEDRHVTLRPIAGTRTRGTTPEHDAVLRGELLSDPKELAEHTMLVDLARNDVGRIADFGSVAVTASHAVERYSHVQHIVSQVEGRLRPDVDAIDALRACFPAGTVSGAPKVRAMEIVDALEPTRRGPYAGAVCYIGWGARAMDAAITIRTAVLRPGWAHVQAGAGIVADSEPEREFLETEHKAGAVLRAVAMAGGSPSTGAPDIFPSPEGSR
ncbi:MAG TPA: anthranilate synthase component I [Gemmatimonadales bacterium]|jgi:anthranilate synthase component 1